MNQADPSGPPGGRVRICVTPTRNESWILGKILPGFRQAWIPSTPTAFGLVDDGADHSGARIHNPRLPWRQDCPVLDLEDIVVLHFQYVVWERMASKQRWYQAWEHTRHKKA